MLRILTFELPFRGERKLALLPAWPHSEGSSPWSRGRATPLSISPPCSEVTVSFQAASHQLLFSPSWERSRVEQWVSLYYCYFTHTFSEMTEKDSVTLATVSQLTCRI